MLRIRTPSLGGSSGTDATASGVTATATASVPTAGAVTADSTAAGVTTSATASGIVGAATASVDVAGVTSTVTATSTVGAAEAASAAGGVTVSATASAIVGTAEAASTAAGITATATASAILGSPAADSTATGVTVTATASSIVGAAYGATADATAAGVTSTATATSILGAATADVTVPGVTVTADAIALAFGASGTFGTGAAPRPRRAPAPARPTRRVPYLDPPLTDLGSADAAIDPWEPSALRGNTLMQPPRRTGDPATDVSQLSDWVGDFYGTFAVEKNLIGTVEALVLSARVTEARLAAAEAKLTAIADVVAPASPASGSYTAAELTAAIDSIADIVSAAEG